MLNTRGDEVKPDDFLEAISPSRITTLRSTRLIGILDTAELI
jgi:hypothetical protein